MLARWGRLLAEIRQPIDRRRFKRVTLMVAHAFRNTARSGTHRRTLVGFVGTGQVARHRPRRAAPRVTDAEPARLGFARQVAKDAARVTPEQVADLRDHGYFEEGIPDIAATAACRGFFNKFLDGLRMEAEAQLLGTDPELREPLVVGRPVPPATPTAPTWLEPASPLTAGGWA